VKKILSKIAFAYLGLHCIACVIFFGCILASALVAFIMSIFGMTDSFISDGVVNVFQKTIITSSLFIIFNMICLTLFELCNRIIMMLKVRKTQNQ